MDVFFDKINACKVDSPVSASKIHVTGLAISRPFRQPGLISMRQIRKISLGVKPIRRSNYLIPHLSLIQTARSEGKHTRSTRSRRLHLFGDVAP